MPRVKFSKPCRDCPYRRASTPGWTGDAEPGWFVQAALSDEPDPPPCHETVDYTDPDWRSKLDDVGACAGALIFARNCSKAPRDPQRARVNDQVQADHDTVFSTPQQFADHHEQAGGMRSWDRAARR